MTWLPAGPDLVFAPRRPSFQRLSRRNAKGLQGVPVCVAVDPNDPATIYTVERPSTGGATAFRTRDGGVTWIPISDRLSRLDANADLQVIAVHPVSALANVVFAGSWFRRRLYRSDDRGDSWTSLAVLPGAIRSIVIDPRGADTVGRTTMYAATTAGLLRSTDGGSTWVMTPLTGDVFSFAARFDPAGRGDHFYATVLGAGVFHAADPTQATTDPSAPGWLNLNAVGVPFTAAMGARPATWEWAVVDAAWRNPARAYAYLAVRSA